MDWGGRIMRRLSIVSHQQKRIRVVGLPTLQSLHAIAGAGNVFQPAEESTC